MTRAAHGDQKYGVLPYMTHIEGVVALAEFFGLSEQEKVVAALHDVFEDTDTSYAEVEKEFGSFVAELVFILTRCVGEEYMNYIARVGKFDITIRVKVCDLLYNINGLSADSTLLNRYRKAIFYLATST
jgi:(p)ppGpp synthase/HD superfamily hydrolase